MNRNDLDAKEDIDVPFQIAVKGTTYYVTPVCENAGCYRFKISTGCDYILTMQMNEDGYWEAEKDVTVLDEDFITAIGAAIEKHDA